MVAACTSSPRSGPATYRGRFAPSPTGPLHAGSLLAALASWLDATHAGGAWLLRIEDIDPPREQAGASAAILADLQRLELRSAEPVLYQSQRLPAYALALQQLLDQGDAFECWCSRSQLAASGGVHRGQCVAAPRSDRPAAIRLWVDDGVIGFEDRIQGHYQHSLLDAVGDFVLRRSDGLYAYQLAVVVDDAWQGITDIVRGSDLLDSTPRQILLQRKLGLPTPRYAHIPVLLGEDGHKLSKQNLAPAACLDDPLARLREAAAMLGQAPAPAGLELPAWLAWMGEHWRMDRVPGTLSLP